jgi:hypothetical protein
VLAALVVFAAGVVISVGLYLASTWPPVQPVAPGSAAPGLAPPTPAGQDGP